MLCLLSLTSIKLPVTRCCFSAVHRLTLSGITHQSYRRKKPLKMFSDNENEAAHRLLENLPEYKSTIENRQTQSYWTTSMINHSSRTSMATLDLDSDGRLYKSSRLLQLINSHDVGVVEKLLKITDSVRFTDITVEDERMTPLMNALASHDQLSSMTDSQLISVVSALRHWPKTDSSRTPNFMSVWNALDIECCKRAPGWSTQLLLRVADYWYHLRLSRISKYNKLAIQLLSNNISAHDASMLVQLLFLINLQRDPVVSGIMDSIEQALLESFDALSIEEISVVAMGFFKSRTPLKSFHLIKAINMKLISNRYNLKEQTLLPALKILRFSMKTPRKDLKNLCLDLQRRFAPVVDTMTINSITHLAFLAKSQKICDEEFLQQMIRRFLTEDLKLVRLKEFTRSIFCVALFLQENVKGVEYVHRVIDELNKDERQEELLTYPDQLVSLLLYASYMNVYPPELIRLCFSVEFLGALEEHASLDCDRELYALDCGIQIECPEIATASGLSPSRREELCKKNETNVFENGLHEKSLKTVSLQLAPLLGDSSCIFATRLLPHFLKKDLLVILDQDGNSKPIPDHVINSPPGVAIKRNTDDVWLTLILDKMEKTIGTITVKERQLKAMGHAVRVIPWTKYESMNDIERKKFLKDLISI